MNILKIVILACPSPSVLSRPLLDFIFWSGQKGGELAGIGASVGLFLGGVLRRLGYLGVPPKRFFATFLAPKK